jgi:hypothetical protein
MEGAAPNVHQKKNIYSKHAEMRLTGFRPKARFDGCTATGEDMSENIKT